MALSIATNTGALMAAASATSVNKDMETSMERLSTGKRINSASDDAAGVAIASRLSSEIRGTNQAIRNAQDGQALIDTAEGAHKEVENILQRMRELAVQSSNDTNDTSDRANLQSEFSALAAEIDRIAGATTWAGQDLMSGTGGTGANGVFNLQVGGNTGSVDTISVSIDGMKTSDIGLGGNAAPTTASVVAFTEAGTRAANDVFAVSIDDGQGNSLTITAAPVLIGAGLGATAIQTAFDALSVAEKKGFSLSSSVFSRVDGANFTAKSVDDGAGAATLVFGAGVASIKSTNGVQIPAALGSRDAALVTINRIDNAIASVNTQRAELGAVSNRLDNTVNNLTSISIQLEGGRGRIEDADFAAESTSLAKSQILQQASTAMLAQANASKQNVLSLLQG
jgi:flagellin